MQQRKKKKKRNETSHACSLKYELKGNWPRCCMMTINREVAQA